MSGYTLNTTIRAQSTRPPINGIQRISKVVRKFHLDNVLKLVT